ncbi:MAG TPA: hypothetical protein VFU88_13315, partial [Ktedonobacterales bacterium]|nr:hypothetical protein [Ktedonobacterales bacterium]
MATAILSRTSVRRIPWALIGRIGLALSVVTFAFQLPFFLSPGLSTVLSELSQMLQLFAVLLLATVFTRTVRISTLVSFWFA